MQTKQGQFTSWRSSFMSSRLLLVAALDEVHEEGAALHRPVPGKGDEARLEVDRANALLADTFIREEEDLQIGVSKMKRKM